MKIIFIISNRKIESRTYIQKKYLERGKYFVLASEKAEILKGDSLKKVDFRFDTSLKLQIEKGAKALLNGKQLVVNLDLNGSKQKFDELINSIRNLGLGTEIINLNIESGNPLMDYYIHSGQEETDQIEIINEILRQYQINKSFEEICIVGGKKTMVKFYRTDKKGKDVFLFITKQRESLDFDSELGNFLKSGESEDNEFNSFQEAFEFIQKRFQIFHLYPLRINEKYTGIFKQAYQKHLKFQESEFEKKEWNEFLN